MRLTRKSRRLRKQLLELLSQGVNLSQACVAVGLSRRTVYNWLAKDAEFVEAVERATTRLIATAERTLLAAIENGDTRAAMWLLERRAPEYRPPHLQPPPPDDDDYVVELEVVRSPYDGMSFDEFVELCRREP
jgi:AcrR family transcriptional regulator